jgi:hypothetical protein
MIILKLRLNQFLNGFHGFLCSLAVWIIHVLGKNPNKEDCIDFWISLDFPEFVGNQYLSVCSYGYCLRSGSKVNNIPESCVIQVSKEV